MRLWIDFETRSHVNIDNGLEHYFNDEGGAELLLCAYAFDDGPVCFFQHGEAVPSQLLEALQDPACEVWAFNVKFEWHCIRKFFGIDVPPERLYDVMVQAAEHGVGMASLDTLCKLLKLPVDKAKDAAGSKLIRKFCVPNKKGTFMHPAEDVEEWAAFASYCVKDVEAMRICAGLLPTYNYPAPAILEYKVQLTDTKVNRRGIPINIAFARKAAAYATAAASTANAQLVYKTNGAVTAITQRAKLMAYLNDTFNLGITSTAATVLEQYVNDENPPELADILDLALNTSAVTAKYTAAATLAVPFTNAPDYGVCRGALVLCGASRTRRWAGRGIQPHNFKRPKLDDKQIAETRADIMAWQPGDPVTHSLGEIGDCVRSMIEAPPGYKLISGDLASIENRALMWLAGCTHEVEYFKQVDAGTAEFDPYEMTYANAFGINPADVDKPKRQVGKLMALLLQYLGGVGGLLKGATSFRLDRQALAQLAFDNCTSYDRERAIKEYQFMKLKSMTYDLPDFDFIGLTILKNKWRDSHIEVVELGKALQSRFCTGGYVNDYLSFTLDPAYTFMQLPSGNVLGYLRPKVERNEISVVTTLGKNVIRTNYYAGKFLENAASGVSRDILAAALVSAEEMQLNPVFTVHDEIVCCVKEDTAYAADALKTCLTQPVAWAKGLPINAAVYEAKYFKKD